MKWWFQKEKKRPKGKILLVFIGLAALIGSFFLLQYTSFFTPSAFEVLPEKNASFVAQVDLEFCTAERYDTSFCDEYQQVFFEFFGDYPARVDDFARNAALALYKNPLSVESTSYLVWLYEVRNEEKATAFADKIGKPYIFHRGWLIMTEEEDFLSLLEAEDLVTLDTADDVQQLLTDETALILFGRSEEIYKNFDLQPALLPALRAFPAFAFMGEEREGDVQFTLRSFAPEMERSFARQEDLRQLFAALPREDLLVAFGFYDATGYWEDSLASLEEVDPSFALMAHSQARKELRQLFGDEISLSHDVLPLFEQSAIFGATYTDGQPRPFLVTQMDNDRFLEAKREKFASAFLTASARFVPRVVRHTLSDGTEIAQVVACEECLSEEQIEVDGGTLSVYTVTPEEGDSVTFALGQVGQTVLFAQDPVWATSFFQNYAQGEDALAREGSEFLHLQPGLFFSENENPLLRFLSRPRNYEMSTTGRDDGVLTVEGEVDL